MKRKNITRRLRQTASNEMRTGTPFLVVGILLVVILNVILFGLSTKYEWYFYTTPRYEHQIGEASQEFLADVEREGPVRIIFCQSAEDLERDDVYRLVWQTACQFDERFDFITCENVNIFLNPEAVSGFIDEDAGEEGTGGTTTINTSSVIFASERQHMVLSMSAFFNLNEQNTVTAYRGEEVMAAMIRYVQTEEHPTAVFTTNHGETFSIPFYNQLVCAGYRIETIDLLREELPAGDVLLVISAPQYDFARGNTANGVRGEIEKIQELVDRGGSVMVTLDPLIQNTVHLEEYLTSCGITVRDGTLRDNAASITADGYTLVCSPAENEYADTLHATLDKVGAGRVILRESAALSIVSPTAPDMTPSALLVSSPSAALYAGGERIDDEGSYTLSAVSTHTSGGGIFVTPSVYLTAQDAIVTNEYGNKDFIYGVLGQTAGADVPLGCTVLLIDNVALEGLTMRTARTWLIVLAVLVPAAVAVTGAVVLTRRKNR